MGAIATSILTAKNGAPITTLFYCLEDPLLHTFKMLIKWIFANEKKTKQYLVL